VYNHIINFGMKGKLLNIINFAKFDDYRLKGIRFAEGSAGVLGGIRPQESSGVESIVRVCGKILLGIKIIALFDL
jgi:hypothetical protein